MESLQSTKRRIKSVQNINQITKAMELVAATKMRRSQEIALSSRPYAFAALDLLATLSKLATAQEIPREKVEDLPVVLERRPIKHSLVVLIASDKGLAGSFNSAVIRKFEKFVANSQQPIASSQYLFAAVGQKAARYLEHRVPKIEERFVRVGDFTALEETKPLADFITNGFIEKKWDEVIVFSTHFRSALKQEPLQRKIFPVDVVSLKETANEMIPETGRFSELRQENRMALFAEEKNAPDYLIEPSPKELLGALIPHLVQMQIYHLILEANASEHAARRMAMKNASDNASDLAEKLSLVYNKARQAAITKEIIEVAAGAEVSA